MDLKGQYLCERIFLPFMWSVTLMAAILTFVLDNVFVMFATFVSGLAASALVSIARFAVPVFLFDTCLVF